MPAIQAASVVVVPSHGEEKGSKGRGSSLSRAAGRNSRSTRPRSRRSAAPMTAQRRPSFRKMRPESARKGALRERNRKRQRKSRKGKASAAFRAMARRESRDCHRENHRGSCMCRVPGC